MLPYLKCLSYLLVVTIAHSLDFKGLGIQSLHQMSKVKADKAEVQVFYESLCPTCVEFVSQELLSTYQKIGSYMVVELYPYGNARRSQENGKTVITCQHGELECYGNKLHACAIDVLNNANQSLFYVSCMMEAKWGGYGSTDMDATKCGESMKIDPKPIIDCANSQKGEDLVMHYGDETDKTHLKYTPWVLTNGKLRTYDKNFFSQVCAVLTNPPPACKKKSENLAMMSYQKCYN